MLRKKTFPKLKTDTTGFTRPTEDAVDNAVVGTTTEYRFLGLLIYKKELFTPEFYGMENYTAFHHHI